VLKTKSKSFAEVKQPEHSSPSGWTENYMIRNCSSVPIAENMSANFGKVDAQMSGI